MTVYVQKEDGGRLCHESSLVYRQCVLSSNKCIAVSSSRIMQDKPLDDCELFVGSVEGVISTLNNMGIKAPEPNYYPGSLSKYLGREVWQSNIREVLGFIAAEQPVFAKTHAWKDITGQVFDGANGNSLLLDRDEETLMWLSQTVNFLSEKRVYVIDGQVIAVCHYDGEESLSVDHSIIEQAVSKYEDAPIAYAFDWGLTEDGATLLVECNDGWAIGAYAGIEASDYYSLLAARWSEIT